MFTRVIAELHEPSMTIMIIASVVLIIATFVNTDIGLIAILLSMLLSPELEAGATASRAVTIRAEDLLLIVVCFAWLAKMAIQKSPPFKKSPLNAPIGVYVAVMCICTIRGVAMGNVRPLVGMFFVVKLVEYYILFFMVMNQTTTSKQVRMFLFILLFTSMVVGIYGNTHIGQTSRISAPFEGSGEPNTLGGYLLFILSLVGGLLLYYKKRRIVLLFIFIFLVPTFFFTLSRASYLGALPALIAFGLLAEDKRVLNLTAVVVILFILTFVFGPPVLRDRVMGAFTPEESQTLKRVGVVSLGPSPAARVTSWRIVLTQKFPKRPFLGYGVSGAGFLDSQYILVLAETGIVGLCCFFWLMWRIWRAAFSVYHTVKTPLFKGLSLGYLVGLIGLLFHAIGTNTFIIIRISEPFWFFTAIVVKLVDIETGKAQAEEEGLGRFGQYSTTSPRI